MAAFPMGPYHSPPTGHSHVTVASDKRPTGMHPPYLHLNNFMDCNPVSSHETSQQTWPSTPLTAMPVFQQKGKRKNSARQKKLLQKVKQAGTAGAISYALWELGFWGISIPVCVVGYQQVTGHWPDFTNKEDMEKVGAEAFAFVNFARLAVPLRIGLALSTTQWIDENVVQKFNKKDGEGESDE